MKRIEYQVTYQDRAGEVHVQRVAMFARDINSGFRKAASWALKDLPDGWEIARVEFWMVTS